MWDIRYYAYASCAISQLLHDIEASGGMKGKPPSQKEQSSRRPTSPSLLMAKRSRRRRHGTLLTSYCHTIDTEVLDSCNEKVALTTLTIQSIFEKRVQKGTLEIGEK